MHRKACKRSCISYTASAAERRGERKSQAPPPAYMRSGTDMPSSPNPVFNTLAVTPANANLEERISSSDFRMGQAS